MAVTGTDRPAEGARDLWPRHGRELLYPARARQAKTGDAIRAVEPLPQILLLCREFPSCADRRRTDSGNLMRIMQDNTKAVGSVALSAVPRTRIRRTHVAATDAATKIKDMRPAVCLIPDRCCAGRFSYRRPGCPIAYMRPAAAICGRS